MQPHTCTTADARVQIGSLWIDCVHDHRIVEVLHMPDDASVLLRPVRDARQAPPSYIEAVAQLGSTYHPVQP